MMDKCKWSNISNISDRLNQLLAIVATTPDPELEWSRKECSILYRSGVTKQIPENEISSLVGVDSSHLWRRMLDSNEN